VCCQPAAKVAKPSANKANAKPVATATAIAAAEDAIATADDESYQSIIDQLTDAVGDHDEKDLQDAMERLDED